ncbi:CRISPR system precrRNA processing endoribonuclease RAMP protein Cas6 [Thermoactinomyces sp. CICC 10523]|uniref:CRISPR system precrRNA processing endoribonuclease RAMP protein Cas6 n=1 Tax=Thermoactinomyces sp. CICC 10523 TaxID=2767428 RepID=UPI0018DEC5C0|nr:CRISPR system precrRNA processing endoribonuclease RAMP protein Cas6 [Thermoactinomyces sp. CICC 10523]MBH8597280.1 CRISPR system precrRNA processing endoribonuclease RAMP protein Cas6 [Thermoactinomyces sp. CICC 10523]
MYRLRLMADSPYHRNTVGVLSKRFHAFVLRSIQSQSPVLSQLLHDRKKRQVFSTHLLLKKGEMWINTPNRELISCIQQHLLLHPEIDLIDWKGIVQEFHCQTYSRSFIEEKFSPNFTLHFLTPTTFYQRGNYYPLPELKRLLSSAAKAYEIFSGEPVDWGDLEPLVHLIRIEQVEVATERVHFGEFNVIGFKGKIAMNIKALPKEKQQMVWKLISYGALMGFGYKTAWGLGQTMLDPLEKRHISEHRRASKKSPELFGNPKTRMG